MPGWCGCGGKPRRGGRRPTVLVRRRRGLRGGCRRRTQCAGRRGPAVREPRGPRSPRCHGTRPLRGASSPRRALRRRRMRSPRRHAAFRVMRRKAAIVCLGRLLNWVNRLTRLFRLEVTDQSEHVFYGEVWKARTSWPFSWLAKGMRPGVRFRTLQGWSRSGLPVPRPGRLSRESSPAYCTASRGRLNRMCATPSKYAKLALLTDLF